MQTTFALESMPESAQGAVNNTSNYIFKYSVNESARFYLQHFIQYFHAEQQHLNMQNGAT
jgi:hypothetical protein